MCQSHRVYAREPDGIPKSGGHYVHSTLDGPGLSTIEVGCPYTMLQKYYPCPWANSYATSDLKDIE